MSKYLVGTWAVVLVAALVADATRAGSPADTCMQAESRSTGRARDTETTVASRQPTRSVETPTDSGSIANSVVPQLLSWISQHTELPYDPAQGVPEVRIVDETELVNLFRKSAIPTALSPEDLRSVARQIAALYHHETRTIYIHRTVSVDSTEGKAAIVHELVHFIQYQLGLDRQVECVSALEKDAYSIQAMYLRAHGAEPEFDAFTVAARSLCDPAAQ